MLLVGLLLLWNPLWFVAPPKREREMHAVEKEERARPKAKETNSVFSAPCALMSCAKHMLPLLIMRTDCGIIIMLIALFN